MGKVLMQIRYTNEVLDGADLSNMALLGVEFDNCSLRRCDFSNSDLSYAEFKECDLYEANFCGACLYVCRFTECDATKALFQGATLNGFRIKDTDISHVDFGPDVLVGVNRKRTTVFEAPVHGLSVSIGQNIESIRQIEAGFSSIFCEDTNISIRFVRETAQDRWRAYRRKSEVARNIERLLSENGYRDRALDYYFKMRAYQTRSEKRLIVRWTRLLVYEYIWGYGASASRPVFASAIIALLFSVAYALLPFVISGAGIGGAQGPIVVFDPSGIDWVGVRDIVIFSIQVATLSVYGDINPIEAGKIVAVIQTVLSVAMVGFSVGALTRRIGNV